MNMKELATKDEVQRKKWRDSYKPESHPFFITFSSNKISIKLRFEILERDNFTCQYCGRNPKEDGIKLEVDHINPKSKGGKNEKENLITACMDCNRGKSDSVIQKNK